MENGLKVLLNHCWCCCELCNVMKMFISLLFCEHVICIVLLCYETWLWQLLCALIKNEKLKKMYHFEGFIVRRDVTNIEGRVVCCDRCMDSYVPHGSWTARQRVCITTSDMYHYTWHCIPLHCTYLSLVNFKSYFVDLLIAFLRNLWLINIELVIADM